MNIAVFGWYHHQNAGDDRIQACLTRWLAGHTLAFLPAGRPPPIHLLRTYDAAIIGGGGLIMGEGGVFRQMRRWVRLAGIPVALVGVSVEGLPAGLRAELRAFLDVCCFAWFRDQGSLDALGPHPNAFVAPDVTWLYPFATLPPVAAGIALNLRSGQGLPQAAWQHTLAGLAVPIYPWPLLIEGATDARALREVLPDAAVPAEFSLDPLRASATVIAGRFHGVLFALQTGRPVIAVSSLPKMRRFLHEQGLETWCLAEDAPERLPDLLAQLQAERPALLADIADLRARLHAEATLQGDAARARLLAAAAALPRPSRRWGMRLRDSLDWGIRF